MPSKNRIIDDIRENIYDNNDQLITGSILQGTLVEMVEGSVTIDELDKPDSAIGQVLDGKADDEDIKFQFVTYPYDPSTISSIRNTFVTITPEQFDNLHVIDERVIYLIADWYSHKAIKTRV